MTGMAYNVLISIEASVREALQQLCETAKGVLFISNKGRLLASLSDGDVRRFLLKGGGIDESAFKAANKSPKFLFSSEREHAQSYLYDNRLTALPIVNEENIIEDIVFWRNDVDVDSVKIRELSSGDLPMVLDFFDQMAGDTRAMFDRKNANRFRLINHLNRQTEDEQIHFAATVKNNGKEIMVGYAFLWDIGKRIPWVGIAVREDWKGHHLGRRLLSHLDNWAKKSGAGGLMLTSVPANIRAHALYERMGYDYCGMYPNGEFLYVKKYDF